MDKRSRIEMALALLAACNSTEKAPFKITGTAGINCTIGKRYLDFFQTKGFLSKKCAKPKTHPGRRTTIFQRVTYSLTDEGRLFLITAKPILQLSEELQQLSVTSCSESGETNERT